ncbi:MAG: glycosyltransferase family 2 protein [Prevotella sp.]
MKRNVHYEYEVSIITVNYNGFEDTCALIDTIPLDENTIEVIVVDNGSARNEAEMLSQRYSKVKTLRSETNLGFAGGNNLGIKHSQGRYIYLINNDTLFKSFDIRSLCHRLDSSESVGVVCPKIRFAWDDCPIQFAGYTKLSSLTLRNRAIGFGETDNGQYNEAHSTPYAHGAAMMLKREVIDKVGYMPECFFLYYEEIDWSMSITRAGYEIWYEPLATIYHKESRSTGQSSPLRTYYLMRNRLLLVRRNFKGIAKHLSYTYLIGIVGTKDILKFTLCGRKDLAKAILRGITDFIKTDKRL